MFRTFSFSPTYADDILSAFDISGSSLSNSPILLSKGLEHDMKQLTEDRRLLEGDFMKATKRLCEELDRTVQCLR